MSKCQAFFSPDQLLHDPQQFMRVGRIHKPADVPARAEALKQALAAHGVVMQEPEDFGRAPLEKVHAPHYLDYLATAFEQWQELSRPGVTPGIEVLPNLSPYYGGRLGQRRPACPSPSPIARTGYYIGDLSSPMGAKTWTSILRSAHSAYAAAEAVTRSTGIAYALCRPSGHHAHYDRASGFCYVNNSAIAAECLRERFGRVAVLDIDAHHGDGTQNIFYESNEVLTISIHGDPTDYFPFYTGYERERGHGMGEGFNLNLPLPHGSGNEGFLAALDRALRALDDFRPAALVVPLGFDTYKDDPISVLRLDFEAYHVVGKRVSALGLPTVIVQEGGYMVEALGPGLAALMKGLAA